MNYKCIVFNGRFLEQRITGVQRFALETIKAIDKIIPENIECFLAVSNNAKTEFVNELKNIRIKKFGKHHGIIWEQTELSRFIRKNHALGVHLCNAVPLFNPKGIVCIHDITYKLHPEFLTTKKHRIIRIWNILQNHIATKKSLAVLTVSEWCKNEIRETFEIPSDKVSVVYNGWQHFSPEISSNVTIDKFPFLKEGDFFFSMSSLAKNKNFKWIIEVAKKNPGLTFAIAGKDLKKQNDNVAETKLDSNVHYLGYVSDDEAKFLMKNSRAFIFPSLYEGFGIPPLEALAFGANVICTNATCLPEIFLDTVHYIDPYNYNVDFDALLSEKVADGKKVLEMYSWKNTAEKVLGVIEKFL